MGESVVAAPCPSQGELSEARFSALWRTLGARREGRDTFLLLRAAYDEPHRAYHTSAHICACLALLDHPTVAACAEHLVEVEAALWFHDAVYDTHASDNEARSAALAVASLEPGVSLEVTRRIANHILATQRHVAETNDSALVVDIDLSILGADADTFDRFEEEIRREYAWVEPAAFAKGRAAVLRSFAERTFVYRTPVLRGRFEARARENIRRRLETLGA